VQSLLTTLAFLLPFPRLKMRILNRLGHDIHPSALIGICLVRHVRRFELAEGAKIGHFNLFGGLDLVRMGRGSRIIHYNQFVSGITLEDGEEAGSDRRTFRMGDNSHIITSHFLDCSGGLIVGDDCWMTGVRSTVLTHAFDPAEGGIILEPVELKKGSIVATSCTLLPGAVVGEGALVAAGSAVWTRQQLAPAHLHGGVPARRLSPVEIAPDLYDFQRYRS
jgi:acetyltransferase-like isoleucine patch superfamily enzyme